MIEPTERAASIMLVPGLAMTSLPSMVQVTKPGFFGGGGPAGLGAGGGGAGGVGLLGAGGGGVRLGGAGGVGGAGGGVGGRGRRRVQLGGRGGIGRLGADLRRGRVRGRALGGRLRVARGLLGVVVAHCSTSPPIMLIVSKVGMRSASSPPFTMDGMADRMGKPGARTWTL